MISNDKSMYVYVAPITIQSDVCITNNSNVTLLNFMVSGEVKTGTNFKLIIFIQAQSCTSTDDISYTVNVEDTCDGSNRSYSYGRVEVSSHVTVPYTPDCTVINITAENTVGVLSLTVNMSEAGIDNFDHKGKHYYMYNSY